MNDPQNSAPEPDPIECTCDKGTVMVDGFPERCPRKCTEGWIYETYYDRHYDLRETEKTGN